jgi:hypothetical protein
MNIRGTLLLAAALVLAAPPPPAYADLADPADAWHVAELRLAEAHRTSRGAGVIVAVLSDGVDAHRDLAGALLPAVQIAPAAGTEHRGTFAAGLIASRGDGRKGLLGVAPEAKILPVNIGADAKARDAAAVARGIDAAVAAKAGVIVLPDPNTDQTVDLGRAIRTAIAAGAVVVAPAGLTWPLRPSVGNFPGVVSVAGTKRDGSPATTLVGDSLDLDLVAPGDTLVVPAKLALGDEYIDSGGAELAPAVVAGVAALVRAEFPALAPQDVVRRLTLPGKRRHTLERGWGPVDPVASLTTALPALPAPVALPTGDVRDRQWYLDALRIPDAHRLALGAGVTVGLIGNSVRAEHPDLAGRVDKPVWIDTKGRVRPGAMPDPYDLVGTGTASIIVAQHNMLGVAPSARLIAVDSAAPAATGVVPALRWLVEHQVKVAVIPGGALDAASAEAVRDAVRRDVVVVRPADDRNTPVPGLLTVVGVGGDGRVESDGLRVDLAAPGGLLTVASSSTATPYTVAASPSAPAAAFVAGVVALQRSADPALTGADAVNRLLQTATAGKGYGRGLVDPVAALTSTLPAVAGHPLGDPGPPAADGASPTGIRWWIVAAGAAVMVLFLAAVGTLLLVSRRARPRR